MEIAGERSSETSAAVIMQHHLCQHGQSRGFATSYGHKQYRPTSSDGLGTPGREALRWRLCFTLAVGLKIGRGDLELQGFGTRSDWR